MIRCVLWAGLLGTIVALAACAHTPAPAYQPAVDNTERLLALPGSARVGDFDAATGVDDDSLSVRGALMSGGADGRYSTYLRDALAAELAASGRLDPGSPVVVRGTLLHNSLHGAADTGRAFVRARFVAKRGEEVLYDRTLDGVHEWESSFLGVLAVPLAMQGYVGAVQALLGELFADPEFGSAIREEPAAAAGRP